MCMRISDRLSVVSTLAVGLCLSLPAWALDGSTTPANKPFALPGHFRNNEDALQQGLKADQAGNVPFTLKALGYAAAHGQSIARWKLAHMYADGEGVNRDDLKAFHYYRDIITSYHPGDNDGRDRAAVSSAYVALGAYLLRGIPKTDVKRNPLLAMRMFQVAATVFRNPDAQYNLAQMFLKGTGVAHDARQAAGWLSLAAAKNHCAAQALLGRILFNGGHDIVRQRAKGLMWLMLARKGATDPVKDAWIIALYDKAMASATDNDRQAAMAYLSDHKHRLN